MALRSDYRTPAATGGAGGIPTGPGFTVADVGRQLSRARNRQGLSLQDVAMRTGIPVDQLRAAETGVLDRPDGLATLKTVRRYADFLGLPGDRFALAILERWPTKGGSPFRHAPGPGSHGPARDAPPLTGPTATVPSLGPLTVPEMPSPSRARQESTSLHETDAPGDLQLDGATRAVGIVGPAERLAEPEHGDRHTGWGAYSETGVTPAVRAPAGQVWRRPRRGVPLALQALVVLVALAVLAGVALLAVDRLRPSWLQTIGLTHRPSAAPAATVPTASHANPSASAATRTSTSAGRAGGSRVLHPDTSASGAVFVVRASVFTVTLTAPGGPCWVDVTTSTSSSPTYAAVIDPGASKTFSGVHSLVVQFGSTGGRMAITSKAGHVSTFAPRTVPYKVTVKTGH